MDANPARPRPIVEAAGVTFPVVVDSQAVLARLYDFDAIPNGLLVDEAGMLRFQHYSGFDVRRPEVVAQLDALLATPPGAVTPAPTLEQQSDLIETLLAETSARADDADLWIALGEAHAGEERLDAAADAYARALALVPDSAAALFGLGTVRQRQGDARAARELWTRALWQDPANFVIRKQIWALDAPEKFWPEIDFAWQRERLAQETAGAFPEIAPPPPRR